MDPFEVVVRGERFRISERTQPGGKTSYDFAWLNGPVGGTYGFTIGRSFVRTTGDEPDADAHPAITSTAEELVAHARVFIEAFFGPGGIGETDFPDHTPANAEPDDAR